MVIAQSVDTYLEETKGTSEWGETLEKSYGSLSRCMLTLFQCVSGGMDWDNASRPLSDVGPILVIIFLGFICFVYFAVLNVMTAVFCQSALEHSMNDHDTL